MNKAMEAALADDEALRERYAQQISLLTARGITDPSRIAVMAAEELGLFPEQADGVDGALDDDVLDLVSGGVSSRQTDGPFNFNAWLGRVLRDALKQNSARSLTDSGNSL